MSIIDAKTAILFLAIQLILGMLVVHPGLRLALSMAILYMKTKDAKTAVMVPIIYWGLAYVMKQFGLYETYADDDNGLPTPQLLDNPLKFHEARLAEAGQIQVTDDNNDDDDLEEDPDAIIVPADTRRTVLFSEADDPDRPDHIEEHPAIPKL
jgi:hypothetical protein